MRILIIDDEANIRKSLRIALEAMNHTVEESAGVADALQRIEQAPFDAAFLDLRLGRESGLDLLETLTGLAPRLAVVIITAFATIDSAVDAMRRGAFDYLAKPFTPAQIRGVIERVERLRCCTTSWPTFKNRSAAIRPRCCWKAKTRRLSWFSSRRVMSRRPTRLCC